MTRECRLKALAEAEAGYSEARRRFAGVGTKAARRDADEDLQLWGGKVAFLSNPKIEEVSRG